MNSKKSLSLRRSSGARLAAIVFCFALVVAACGTDSSEPAATGATDTTDAAPEDTTDAAPEDTTDAAPEDVTDAAPEDTTDAAPEGVTTLDDPYSLQIAANADIDVDTTEFAATAPFKVATIVQGPINGWGTIFDATMDERMKESGKFDMDARLYVPWGFDIANQAAGIEDAISQGVDAIMLTSLSRSGLAASVERATAAGVPVLLCMAGAETEDFVAEVSSNQPRQGYDSAKAVAEKMGGEGKVALIHGIAGVDAAEFWKLGATTAFAEYPDIEIVAEQNANWSTADALEVMRTILVQQPDIDAIWTGGFEMGVGIVDAYNEAGIDVPFMGGTGITNGFLRQAIDQGLDFYAVQFPPGGAYECVDSLVDMLEGNPLKKYTDVATVLPNTGGIDPTNAEEHYQPQFNDDFIGPMLYSDALYEAAGF